MRILEVIEAKRWKNVRTGATASIYGCVPWTSDSDKTDWSIQVCGYTWRNSNGTVGLGRVPASTKEEADRVMHAVNSLCRE